MPGRVLPNADARVAVEYFIPKKYRSWSII
ncbi:hypothetical protein A2U01_0045264, partial [Trifolium medium]|nr:hypothetical protein [Trifolium medium]